MPIQKYIVSRDDSRYEAFPDVTMTKDRKKLVCVFTECMHHLDRNNSRIMITESFDKGRTWSQKKALSELTQSGNQYNCARISTLPDGRLCVVCDKAQNTGLENGSADNFAWFSSDDGKTWGEKIKLPAVGIVPDKYRVLSNGRHIVSCHSKSQSTGKLEQFLWYSDDGGKSWSDKVVVASDERYNLCEGNILETKDGKLVCFLRENTCIGIDCVKVISEDFGESWSPVSFMAIPACHRPVSGYLNSGKILLTYRFLQGAASKWGENAQNFFGALFDEKNATAPDRAHSGCRIFPIDHDRSMESDLGYSGWVQLDDGEIYVVSYIVDDAPNAQIRGYSFYESDVVL